MLREDVNERIASFIIGAFPAARERGLRDGDDLLEEGILDSLGVLDVVAFIEREFGITVADDDLVPEHFRSVERLAAFVRGRRNGDGNHTGGE